MSTTPAHGLRQLSKDEARTLSTLLIDTDDDLELGISQLGYDPDTVARPRLGIGQCSWCGFWTRKGHKCGPNE